MKRFFLIVFALASGLPAWSQGFEWADRQDVYQAGLGQTVRIPIRIKNTSDKPQFFIIRKAQSDLGSNQKGYFCLGDECLDPGFDRDHVVTFSVDAEIRQYGMEQTSSLARRLVRETQDLPGVSSAAIAARGLMRGACRLVLVNTTTCEARGTFSASSTAGK